MNLLSAHPDLAALKVDLEVSGPLQRLRTRCRAGQMPDGDADARQELADAERLGEVVIRAEVEGSDLVVLRAADGQNDDGGASAGADLADDLDSVEVG